MSRPCRAALRERTSRIRPNRARQDGRHGGSAGQLDDLTELATGTATGPQQIAAILRLEAASSGSMVRQALGQRLGGVPRLRQRLMPTAVGLGRPIWVDDVDFDFGRHVQEEVCTDPSSEATALQVAAAAAVDPLPRDRPLWRLTLILDSARACHSLILVVHHVLANGSGGSRHSPSWSITPRPSRPPRSGRQLGSRRQVRLDLSCCGTSWRAASTLFVPFLRLPGNCEWPCRNCGAAKRSTAVAGAGHPAAASTDPSADAASWPLPG